MSTRPPSASRAFTLVEMLVVLGIIGVLIALLMPAVVNAVIAARKTQITMEIKQLDLAFDTYKQQKGEYPPSFGERNNGGALIYNITMGTPSRYTSVVERHLQTAFPKFKENPNPMVTNDMKDNFYNNVAMNIDQGEALVLWLGGTATSPANPFQGLPNLPAGSVGRNVFFEFAANRLVDADGDGFPTYQPRHCRDTDYIYMEARCYPNYMRQNNYARSGTGNQQVLPYGLNPTNPVNPQRFQIVCAGFDGDFGMPLPAPVMSMYPAKIFPGGGNYQPGDKDNLTNFSEGQTLGDARPQ